MNILSFVEIESCTMYWPFVRLGAVMRASSLSAIGSMRDCGIRAFGNGSLVNGSVGFFPELEEKSPERCAAVGGNAEEESTSEGFRKPWYEPKKKILFRLMGPPPAPP